MAKRDILKTIESGRNVLSEQRGLTLTEAKAVLGQKGKDFLDIATDFYYIGIALGYRQAQADAKGGRQ